MQMRRGRSPMLPRPQDAGRIWCRDQTSCEGAPSEQRLHRQSNVFIDHSIAREPAEQQRDSTTHVARQPPSVPGVDMAEVEPHTPEPADNLDRDKWEAQGRPPPWRVERPVAAALAPM